MKALFVAPFVALATAIAVPAFAAPLAGDVHAMSVPPEVSDTSFTAPDGSRTLQESVTIDAPVATLWKAFVDPAEFRRWNAPVAFIDLRTGGSLEASYDPAKRQGDPDNIKQRIIAYLPERLIVFQNIQAPAALPGREAFQKVVAILEYQPLSPDRTKVTLSQTGWGSDPASDGLYKFFANGNAQLLVHMKAVYEGRAATAK